MLYQENKLNTNLCSNPLDELQPKSSALIARITRVLIGLEVNVRCDAHQPHVDLRQTTEVETTTPF